MAINMMNKMNSLQGYAMNMALRKALYKELYAQTIVIKKFDVLVKGKDDKNDISYKMDPYYGTIGMNPVADAFGLNYEARMNNVPVEVPLEDSDETEARRITIDGDRYILCDNLVTVSYVDKEDGKPIPFQKEIIEEHDDKGFMYNGELYRVLGASPSNEKKSVKFFYRVTDKVKTELDAFNIMDEVAGHVFSYKFSGILTAQEIAKFNTRWGNYLTTMKCFYEIDLNKDYIYVIPKDKGALVGAYDFDEATREAMDAAGIEIDNHINDGAVIHTIPCIQEIAKAVGVDLSDKDASRVSLQMRETVMTAKVMCITMSEADAKAVALNNNAVPYGNEQGRLMGVYDEDGAKLINFKALEDKTETIKLYVLAMAKTSDISSNGQHLIKYMAVDPDTTVDFLSRQFKSNLKEFFTNTVNGRVASDTVNARIIRAIGTKALQTTSLVETIVKEVENFSRSAIAKTRVAIDGVYNHMSFDMTYALTNGKVDSLLGITEEGFVEAYCADVNRKLSKETRAIECNPNLSEEDKAVELTRQRTGVVIKHPSAMPDEYEIVYYLTEKQMKQRISDKLKAIKNNTLKAELKTRLTRYVDEAPWGVTIYAPLNAMKNKLAGADVDFDATLTDMSELKFILIKERLATKDYMGKCTFISYKNIDRSELVAEEDNESLDVK